MAGPVAGETPPGVHLLHAQGVGHLDLQNRIIRYRLLKVAGDVQPLVLLKRRFSLMGVTVLTRRAIRLIIRHPSSGSECCGLMEPRLVPLGLTGGLQLTSRGTCTLSIQPPVPGYIGLVFLDGLVHLLGPQAAVSESSTCLISSFTPFSETSFCKARSSHSVSSSFQSLARLLTEVPTRIKKSMAASLDLWRRFSIAFLCSLKVREPQ